MYKITDKSGHNGGEMQTTIAPSKGSGQYVWHKKTFLLVGKILYCKRGIPKAFCSYNLFVCYLLEKEKSFT